MPRNYQTYICENCGETFSQWSGKCLSCGEWNTLREFKLPGTTKSVSRSRQSATSEVQFVTFSEVKDTLSEKRISTGIAEVDEVLGGGIVPGAAMVLGGDPGIGKSTLALQITGNIKGSTYIAGEESVEQISLRAKRLKDQNRFNSIKFTTDTNVLAVIEALYKYQPEIVVADSIQTLYHPDFPSTPGSIVQVRESALALQQYAKSTGVPVLLIGHVTKGGEIAGPRLLEHLVDVVIYLEGERLGSARILRSTKNRFGPSGEVGVLQMLDRGLVPVASPATIFLEHTQSDAGRVITCIMDGNRPFLVEVEALVAKSNMGFPRRNANGFDLNRLYMLLAVLEERVGLKLASLDVYLNVVGGISTKDRAADAAVCLAIASAIKAKAPAQNSCVFGEVDLLGRFRKVLLENKRINESKKLGLNPIQKESVRDLIFTLL